MDTKKLKQVAFTGGVALLTILIVNSLARRSAPVAKLRDTIQTGI